jgi:hypothetical protein
MSHVPSRPIGQDPQSQMLWVIAKQLEQLIGVVSQLVTYPTTTTTTTTSSTTTTTTTAP